MRALSPCCAALAVVASLAVPAAASAQDDAAPEEATVQEARAMFDRGRALAEERRFAEAAEAFERSYRLVERPSTAFNLALCQYALGRHVEAIEVLERYREQADPAEEGDAYHDALQMLDRAREAVGTILLEVSPVDAYVSIDGEGLTGGATRRTLVNPGAHVVRAQAPHHRELLLELTVGRGETVRRALALADARTPAELSVRVPGFPDAVIEVDGELAGHGSVRVELEAGEHAVRVTHPRLRTHERTLRLEWAEHASVLVDPAIAEPTGRPVAEEPALWIGVAAAAAAIGAAVAIGVVVDQQSAPSGGSTGVVLQPRPARAPMLVW